MGSYDLPERKRARRGFAAVVLLVLGLILSDKCSSRSVSVAEERFSYVGVNFERGKNPCVYVADSLGRDYCIDFLKAYDRLPESQLFDLERDTEEELEKILGDFPLPVSKRKKFVGPEE